MITVTLNNSTSCISGLSVSQLSQLRELMSYDSDPSAVYRKGFKQNTKRYLLDKRGEFPTGIFYIVLSYIKSAKISDFEVRDLRIRPKPYPYDFVLHLSVSPHPWQREAATACKTKDRGIVTAPTGTGKALAAALIINELKVKTLLVVPTLELKWQLSHSLKMAFPNCIVGELDTNPHIAVENVDALDTTKVLLGYGAIIIDEFHHSAAATYRKLNKTSWKNIYHRYGLTATPFRSQDNERLLLESILAEVIYKLPYTEAVDSGYIVPLEAYYIDVPHKDTEGYTYAQVYKDLVTNNEPRNIQIAKLLQSLHSAKKSTLCLVKEIEHGNNLNCLSWSGFAHGQDEERSILISGFNQGKLTTLIGTTGILGEGVDTKPAEFVIIAGLGKSRNAFMQQCGRAFRVYPGKESAKIIIFRDKSHKYTLRHFKEQCKILKLEYGIIPRRLEI